MTFSAMEMPSPIGRKITYMNNRDVAVTSPPPLEVKNYVA
jgi:hypothetical protein